MDTLFGSHIGRYILLEKIGQGGMAEVYNAYDPHLGCNVALKIILPHFRHSKEFLERFFVEAKALAQLSHANIVKVIDYGVENDQPYLVMDYIYGGTLKDYMNHPIPWQQAATILAPVARALVYVHKQKIIHRDIKPSNILLNERYQPMLSDFGLVKIIDENEQTQDITSTNVGIGTPEYLSPEQGFGKSIDHRADIYALGVVFYEMITGQKPFTADTPMGVVIKHTTETAVPPHKIIHELPPLVENVILQAMQKEPEKRFHDMEQFAIILEEIAKGSGAKTTLVKKQLTQPRNKKFIPVIISLLTILVVIAAMFLNWRMLDNIPLLKQFRSTLSSYGISLAPFIPTPAVTYVEVYQTPKVVKVTVIATVEVTKIVRATDVPTTPSPTLDTVKSTITETPKIIETPTTKPYANNISLKGTPVDFSISTGGDDLTRWGLGGGNTVAWSIDGSEILLGTTNGLFGFDPQTFEQMRYINIPNWVETVQYDRKGEFIITGSRDGQVLLYDSRSGDILSEYPYKNPKSERLEGDTNSVVQTITFSDNGNFLAVGYANGAINLWNRDSDEVILNLDQYSTTSSLAISPDNRFLYGSNMTNKITVWNIETGKEYKTGLIHPSSVSLMARSLDGSYLLSGGVGHSAYLWDIISEPARILYTYTFQKSITKSLAISPDNQYIAVGLENGEIWIYSTPTEENINKYQNAIAVIPAHPDAINDLEFSLDGAILASTSWLEGLRLWDTANWQETGSLDRSDRQITQLEFSLDGKWLAEVDITNTLRIWDVERAEVVYEMQGYLPEGGGFSPKSTYILVPEDGEYSWVPGTLRVIDLSTGSIIKELDGFEKGWLVKFSDKEDLLVAGNMRKAIIWDTLTWERLQINGGLQAGCGQYFSPDRRRLAVISEVDIYFSWTHNIEKLCAINPQKTNLKYYDIEIDRAIYQYSDSDTVGALFWASPEQVYLLNYDRLESYRSCTASFLSAFGEDHMIAYTIDGKYLEIRTVSHSSPLCSINNCYLDTQLDYQYVVAYVNAKNQLLALGDRFGTIHLRLYP